MNVAFSQANLASCIMPTADRRSFVPQAIALFLAQDYPDKELVILDDGADAVGDLIPDDPRLRYHRIETGLSLGTKRNRACELARGDIILHWDDDDWYAPHRISLQVAALRDRRADIAGIRRALFADYRKRLAWEYVYPVRAAPWVCGAALCFRRRYWESQRFADISVGEDTDFVARVSPGRLARIEDNDFFVARLHGANTASRPRNDARWQAREFAMVEALTGGAWGKVPAKATRNDGADTAPHTRCSLAAMDRISVVVPHGGAARLPLLTHMLDRLRRQAPSIEIIVAELGEVPVGRAACDAVGAIHLYSPTSGPFDRARACNLGAGLARNELLLFHDNDLLAPDGFLDRMLAEFDTRGLDQFQPFVAIDYLAERDSPAVIAGARALSACRPEVTFQGAVTGGLNLVRRSFFERVGGMITGFRNWGGEDDAWWHKAATLGRVGNSSDPAQRLWHLFHPKSGGIDHGIASNHPDYAGNVAKLRDIQAARSAVALSGWRRSHGFAAAPFPIARPLAFLVARTSKFAGVASTAARSIAGRYGVEIVIGHDPARLAAIGAAGWVLFDVPASAHGKARALSAGAPLIVVRDDAGRDGDADGVVAGSAPGSVGPPLWNWNALRGAGDEPLRIERSIVQALARLLTPSPAISPAQPRSTLPAWAYWEGPCPDWIRSCQASLKAHGGDVRLLDRRDFEQLRERNRDDLPLDRLQPAHRADVIRAFLIAHRGGMWIDSDCIAMRPLRPLLDMAERHGFVAHREREGWFSNGLFAALPGNEIAMALYREVAARLRSGRFHDWMSFGGEPLTDLLRESAGRFHELPTHLIQPICWSRPAAFFERGAVSRHAANLEADCFTYMLSNTRINQALVENPALDLMHPDSFFRFLIDTSAAAGDGRE